MHRARRDQLRLMVADLGADPVAAGAAYDEPAGLRGPSRVARAALRTEQACAETYAALVAADRRAGSVAGRSPRSPRRRCSSCAWGARPRRSPGLPSSAS